MTTFLIIIGTIIIVFAMIYFLAPQKYEIHRTVSINKPMPEVFSEITSLKFQDYWSPWGNDIEDDEFIHTGKEREVGFKSSWHIKHKFYEIAGEHEITKIVENRTIETVIRYTKPVKATAIAFMNVYEANETKTDLIWVFKGDFRRPVNVFTFFLGIDSRMGRSLEVALNKIKFYIEAP